METQETHKAEASRPELNPFHEAKTEKELRKMWKDVFYDIVEGRITLEETLRLARQKKLQMINIRKGRYF